MTSVFQSTKKKEPTINTSLMSMAPKAKPTYTAGTYSSVNPLAQITNTLKNPTTAWKSSFKATTPTKSVFSTSSQPAQPNMSVAPKVIQGSGMTSAYASNPTNYKPPVSTPPPKPTAQPTLPSPHEAYAVATEKLAAQQADLASKRQVQREASTKSKYQTLKEMISGQLPVAEGNFNAYKADSDADIADLKATGERQKGQAEDYYGDAQRDAARTYRDTQGQNQRTFANLGTIDSRGEGSFQQATENTTSDFNRFTQQTLKAKADKFAEIDSTVATAERQAMAAIRQEAGKLEDLKKQIQFALINNDQALADELSGIAQESEQTILSIQEAVTGLKYQADLEKYKVELESNDDLSTTFLTTGVPQTEADFTWKLQNAKEYGEAFPNMVGNSEAMQKANEVMDTSNLIDRVLGSNTDNLTGVLRAQGGWNPWANLDAKGTSSLINQVSNQLQLAAAGKLKGQGQITENERAILRDAVLALNPDGNGGYALSDDELRRRLKEAQAILMRNAGMQSTISQVDNNALISQYGG